MLSSTVRMGFAPIVAAITHALGDHEVVKSLYTPPPLRIPRSGKSAAMDKEITSRLPAPTALAPRYREPAYPYPGFERTPDAVINEEEEKPAPVKKAPKKKSVIDEESERLFGLLTFTSGSPPLTGWWYLTRVRGRASCYFYHVRFWDGKWSLGMSPFRQARAAGPDYYLKGKPSFDQDMVAIEWARSATLAEINGL